MNGKAWVAAGTIAAGLVGGASMAVLWGQGRWRRESAAAVAALRDAASARAAEQSMGSRAGTPTVVPEPVARFFAFALASERPAIRLARIRWSGEFRIRPNAKWSPFTATQHFSVDPPGFVWDAAIRMLPGVRVRVRDRYLRGEGGMLGRVAGVIPVVDQGGTPEIAQSALARWLGEAAWFPTALLPGHAVRWAAVDGATARATARDGEVSASAEFHFGPDGEIESMRAMRYRDVGGRGVLTPFEGRYRRYRPHAGIVVPADAEVAWILPEGRFAYWRGRVEEAHYQT